MDENAVVALIQIRDVDEQTRQALKLLAVLRRQSMNTLLRELLDRYVDDHAGELPKDWDKP